MKTARNLITFTALLLMPLTVLFAGEKSTSAGKPNIIFILADDLGWTDLGCFGSKYYETPNLDRLASQGMRFTDAYSSCTVCSPSRASILTGQYPARLHITDWIPGYARPKSKLLMPGWTRYLPLETMNIAKALKPAGYVSASIGKWHLGGEQYYPDKQDFDLNIAGTHAGQPLTYFSPYKIETLQEDPDGQPYLTDRLTAEALKFIENNQSRSFFLYLPHFAVHTPLMAKPEVVRKYLKKADPKAPQNNPTYAGMVEGVDDSVGAILRKLDELKLVGNTIVIFTSDNGGLLASGQKNITSNVPLRAGKGSAYEGGVRVPLIIKWPGVTKPGSVSAAPVIGADFYPTMLAMAGAANAARHVVDGENLEPVLRRTGALNREAIYWHYPHYHPGGAKCYGAIREGDFRLIEFYEDNHVELYQLKDDIGEQQNLAGKLPDKAAALRQKLHEWRQRVGAQMPTPNPDYDPQNPG
ncbi:MAG: sulfatase [Verrucomicrobiota bacterium]